MNRILQDETACGIGIFKLILKHLVNPVEKQCPDVGCFDLDRKELFWTR